MTPPHPARPRLETAAAVPAAMVRGVVPLAELRTFFDDSFRALSRVLGEQGAGVAGPAFGLFRVPVGSTPELAVGFPTSAAIEPDGPVVAGSLPGGPVATLTHLGSFDGLAASWYRLEEWMREQGLGPGEVRWESYVTRPAPDVDPAGLRTELVWPVAG